MELRVCTACRQLRSGHTVCPGCAGPLTLADEKLFLGESFGKYRVDGILGAGGMGVVYRATHATLNRPAAVKIVLPQLGEIRFQKRFLREAQVLADLKHPNIVEVYDFDVSEWGSPYFVMECLEGATLRGLLRSAPGAPLPADQIALILGQLEAALGFAHRKGVIHRDLKPDNIFIADFDGRAVAKVLDFGIAKLLASEATDTQITATGMVVGTPNYLAPEQILGQPVGAWTDQYALGLIVAELLSGRGVRTGKTIGEILREDIRRSVPLESLPASVSMATRQALTRATQPDPAARFPDVRAFVEGLELASTEGASARLAAAVRATHSAPEAAAATPTSTLGIDASTGFAPAPRGAPTAASRTEALASRPRRQRLALGFLAVGLVAAAVLGLRAWRASPAGSAGTKAPSAVELFTHRRDIAVPPDATEVIQKAGDTLVLRGGSALYLLPESGTQAATRIALPEGAVVAGGEATGRIWLVEGRRLVALEPLQQQREVVVESLPPLQPLAGVESNRIVVSPSGLVALVQPRSVEVCAVQAGVCEPRFVAPIESLGRPVVRLSDKYLAVAQPSHALAVYRTRDGRRVLEAKLGEERINDVALLDDVDLVAVSGWFDHVDVHPLVEGRHAAQIHRDGGALSLVWLADHPTLLMSGVGSGVDAWRPEGAPRASLPGVGSGALFADGSVIAALDPSRHSVALFDYASLPAPRRVSLSPRAIWALEATPSGTSVYAGGSDGVLYVYDPKSGHVDSHQLHSDGITDLALRGDLLASTSDDKTVAVWQTPQMSVVWRTKAHAFLVNQLSLRGDPPQLWTASSDGTIKRWAWPQIDEQESLDVKKLLGHSYVLHAIWADPAAGRVLAGTWNNALLVFRRQAAAGWSAQKIPVSSQALYRAIHLPAVAAVLLVGIHPSAVFVYDLQSASLHELRSFGQDVYSAVAGSDGSSADVLGNGCVLRYAFHRDGAALSYAATVGLRTDLGTILAATRLPGPDSLVGATEDGALLLLDGSALSGEPLVRETLPVP